MDSPKYNTMKGYKLGFYVMTAAFAATLAFHVVSSPPPGPTPAPAAPDNPPAAHTASPSTATPQPSEESATLREQLAACRESSWELVAKVVSDDSGRAAEATQPAADASDPRRAHLEQQRDALIEVALEHLAGHWQGNRKAIMQTMAHVGNAQWVEADIAKKVAAHAKRFDLNRHDEARLEREYGALWGEYGDNMQELIKGEDRDGLMDEVRAFWRDEDRMIGRTLGQDQRATFREADTKSRTTIMAILAIFSGAEWGEGIAWQ